MIAALEGTAEERLRISADWAAGDNRSLLASACRDGAEEIQALRLERDALLAALTEIVLRTHSYQDCEDWPLVSGVNSVARAALTASKATGERT
jgi:hypothetical protein